MDANKRPDFSMLAQFFCRYVNENFLMVCITSFNLINHFDITANSTKKNQIIHFLTFFLKNRITNKFHDYIVILMMMTTK